MSLEQFINYSLFLMLPKESLNCCYIREKKMFWFYNKCLLFDRCVAPIVLLWAWRVKEFNLYHNDHNS